MCHSIVDWQSSTIIVARIIFIVIYYVFPIIYIHYAFSTDPCPR